MIPKQSLKATNTIKHINPYKRFVGSLIPNWLLQRKEISPGAKLCYGRLCQYSGKNGQCYPKQITLARELGCSRSQVIRYINELVKHGLIEKIRVGLQRANRYKFLRHKWMQLKPSRVRHPDVAHVKHPDTVKEQHPVERESIQIESAKPPDYFVLNKRRARGGGKLVHISEILKELDPKFKKYAEKALEKCPK